MENFGKIIFGVGLFLVVVGLLLWFFGDKLSWLGQLPGDIKIERPGFRLYAPLTSMIIISIILSIVLSLVGKFLR